MVAISLDQPIPIAPLGFIPTVAVEPEKKNILERVRDAYFRAIKSLDQFLLRHNWYITRLVLCTLLAEPWQCIKGAFLRPFGLKKHFNFYKMNPKELTEKQTCQRAVLLIHGNFDNQRVWLSLGKRLKKENIGPVFTVNLPNGVVTNKDKEVLDKKLTEIGELYKKSNHNDFKIDIVGHSRGAYLASLQAFPNYNFPKPNIEEIYDGSNKDTIGKMILIGNPLRDYPERWAKYTRLTDRLYEINGKYDVLIDESKSNLAPDHKFTVKCGHLGLVSSTQVHNKVVEWLQA